MQLNSSSDSNNSLLMTKLSVFPKLTCFCIATMLVSIFSNFRSIFCSKPSSNGRKLFSSTVKKLESTLDMGSSPLPTNDFNNGLSIEKKIIQALTFKYLNLIVIEMIFEFLPYSKYTADIQQAAHRAGLACVFFIFNTNKISETKMCRRSVCTRFLFQNEK